MSNSQWHEDWLLSYPVFIINFHGNLSYKMPSVRRYIFKNTFT